MHQNSDPPSRTTDSAVNTERTASPRRRLRCLAATATITGLSAVIATTQGARVYAQSVSTPAFGNPSAADGSAQLKPQIKPLPTGNLVSPDKTNKLNCQKVAFIGVTGVGGGGGNEGIADKRIPFMKKEDGKDSLFIESLKESNGDLGIAWLNYDPAPDLNSWELASAYGGVKAKIGVADEQSKYSFGLSGTTLDNPAPRGLGALPEKLLETERGGVVKAVQGIYEQATKCPDQEYILAGYSEGAWVLGDALAQPDIQELLKGRIKDVYLFGDPMFDGNSAAARRPGDVCQREWAAPNPSSPPKAPECWGVDSTSRRGMVAYALDPYTGKPPLWLHEDGKPVTVKLSDGKSIQLQERTQYLPKALVDKTQSYCFTNAPDGKLDPICGTPGTGKQSKEEWRQWIGTLEWCGTSTLPVATYFLRCPHSQYEGIYAAASVSPTGAVRIGAVKPEFETPSTAGGSAQLKPPPGATQRGETRTDTSGQTTCPEGYYLTDEVCRPRGEAAVPVPAPGTPEAPMPNPVSPPASPASPRSTGPEARETEPTSPPTSPEPASPTVW